MEKLFFDRRKYGKDLLIDAASAEELNIVDDTLVLSFHTLIFLEKGSGWYGLDADRMALKDRTVLFIRPGQINQIAEAHFEKGIFLFFEREFLDSFFSDRHFLFKFTYFRFSRFPAMLNLPYDLFHKYYDIASEIRDEIKQLTLDSHHILRSLIYYLLIRLNQQYGQQYGSPRTIVRNVKVLQFLELLEDRYKDFSLVQNFADALGISRVHLNNLCREQLGKPAGQIIRQRILDEARKQLIYSDKDISTIAHDLHFSAPPHFSRFFKKESGVTPQEFRAEFSKW